MDKNHYTKINGLIVPKKEIDWPILIKQLKKDANISTGTLANVLGTSRCNLDQVISELRNLPDEMNIGGKLLHLYLLNSKQEIPLFGNHNEVL